MVFVDSRGKRGVVCGCKKDGGKREKMGREERTTVYIGVGRGGLA